MLRLICALLINVIGLTLTASDLTTIDIGILGPVKPAAVQLIVEFGLYNIVPDRTSVITLRARERAAVVHKGDHLELSVPGRVVGTYKRINFKAREADGVFRLFVLRPVRDERDYDGDLNIAPRGKEL